MLTILAAAIAVHPIVRNIPEGVLGSTITVGNILQGIMAFLLGGNFIALLSNKRKERKDREDTAIAMRKIEHEEGSSLRTDLMGMMKTRDQRISELEDDVVAERQRCATEMASMQKRHDDAVAELRGEIRGLRDNMIQHAKSGDVLRLHANAPTSVDKFFDGPADVAPV